MVRASGLRGYGALMRQLGTDPARLLERYRIDESALADEDALLPLRAVVHLLEASAAATDCDDFGLRMSHRQDISVLGPLAIVMQNAPTVRAAMNDASRYMFVHSPGLVVSLHEQSTIGGPDCAELRFELGLSGQPAQRQTFDLCIGDIHHMIQLLGGEHYALRTVTLPHTPLAPVSVYRRFFGVPVLTDQLHGGLHFERATLDADLRAVNHSLRRLAMDYLTQQFGSPAQTLSARVHQALRRTLGTPQNSKTAIAALLGVHPRTLQRHLKQEGSSYEAIREQVLQDTALRYLRETRVPMSQLAGLLGFSEQSAMTRSCRRWFGKTPSAIRRAANPATPETLEIALSTEFE